MIKMNMCLSSFHWAMESMWFETELNQIIKKVLQGKIGEQYHISSLNGEVIFQSGSRRN